jgi:hypothetical protein
MKWLAVRSYGDAGNVIPRNGDGVDEDVVRRWLLTDESGINRSRLVIGWAANGRSGRSQVAWEPAGTSGPATRHASIGDSA